MIVDAVVAPDDSLLDLVEAVRAIPYGRPSERTVDGMLREQRGTCSTKHLFLATYLMSRSARWLGKRRPFDPVIHIDGTRGGRQASRTT